MSRKERRECDANFTPIYFDNWIHIYMYVCVCVCVYVCTNESIHITSTTRTATYSAVYLNGA